MSNFKFALMQEETWKSFRIPDQMLQSMVRASGSVENNMFSHSIYSFAIPKNLNFHRYIAIMESEQLMDQSDRSNQIVLSIGIYVRCTSTSNIQRYNQTEKWNQVSTTRRTTVLLWLIKDTQANTRNTKLDKPAQAVRSLIVRQIVCLTQATLYLVY